MRVSQLKLYLYLVFINKARLAQKHTYFSLGDHVHTLLRTVPSAALCVSVKSLIATLVLQK